MGLENCYNNDHCDNKVNSEMYFKNEKLIKRNAKKYRLSCMGNTHKSNIEGEKEQNSC